MSKLEIWLNHCIPCWKLYWLEYLHLYQSSKLTEICCFLVSLVSPKNKQSSIRKFKAFFQFRAIWNILALVNKFSLYPLHGNAIIGNAQIFETLRLWRPLEPRENATSRVLLIHKIVAISVCLSVFLFFSNLWKMPVFLLKYRLVH